MSGKLPLVLWFSEIDSHDRGIAGELALKLGEMRQAEFTVPNGFVLTSHAYFKFLRDNLLIPKIKELLETIHFEHPDSLFQVSQQISSLIIQTEISHELLKTIDDPYRKLGGILSHPLVSVHSACVTEELLPVSLAGHEQIFPSISGETNLILAIREAWTSLFSPKAIKFRHEHNLSHFNIGSAIVVQKAINAEQSGIIHTADPTTGDKSKITIEAVYGDPTGIRKGNSIPDRYEVKKSHLTILEKSIGTQTTMLHKGEKLTVPPSDSDEQKITDNQILDLALLGKKLEQYYYFSQEVTWVIADHTLFILQTTPLHLHTSTEGKPFEKLPLLLKGTPASPGLKSGYVKILQTLSENTKIIPDEIVVLKEIPLHHLSTIKKAAAIIIEQGGKTTQASHIFRELGIPAIVEAKKATQLLNTGELVTVNGTRGEIYKGSSTKHNRKNTATKLYAFLDSLSSVEKVADQHPDGILFVPTGKRHISTQDLTNLCETIQPQPVMYETTPYDNDLFRTELEAVATVRKHMNHKNLGLSLPSIHTVKELESVKDMLSAADLQRSPTFKLWLTIDLPSQVIILDKLIETGIDGVVLNLKALTHLLLGGSYQDPAQNHPAVLWALEQTIKTAHKHHLTVAVYGQLQKFHPSVLEKLVQWGITSIIEEPTHLEQVRQTVAHIERNLILNK